MGDIFAYFAATPPQVVVPALVSIMSIIIGVAVVIYQLGRQAENALKQARKNEQLKRKVEIFEKITEVVREAVDRVIAHTSYVRSFMQHLDYLDAMREFKPVANLPVARVPEYQRLSKEAMLSIAKVTRTIEEWHIIDPKLDIFRECFGMALEEIYQIGLSDNPVIFEAMPIDGRESEWSLPQPEMRKRLAARFDKEMRQWDRLSCWLKDLQAELQLVLLSELFDQSVERRDPPDPDFFCIRLDRYDEIRKSIDASEWGSRAIMYEAEAWARFSGGVR